MGRTERHHIFTSDVASYEPHPLHTGSRDWIESNCYIDLYVELLHALGMKVEPCLSFTLASDFESDQWTFFKPPLVDLDELYGLDVQELTLYRSLPDQIEEQVRRGCIVAPEVDAFYLPDVTGTDYRTAHVKTTIAICGIDLEHKRLRYFHNAGFFQLEGDDFDGLFSIGKQRSDGYLPPYCELLKLRRLRARSEEELLGISLRQARRHYMARPVKNPFLLFSERFDDDLPRLLSEGQSAYHAYVFVTLRQCGANFEYAAFYLDWLVTRGYDELSVAAARFRSISQTCKMLILKLARMVRAKKGADLSDSFRLMADVWEEAMGVLESRLAAPGDSAESRLEPSPSEFGTTSTQASSALEDKAGV